MNAQRTLPGLFAAIVVVLAACSSSTPAASASPSAAVNPTSPTSSTTQTSDGGEVTVVADWAGPDAGAVFGLTLDTHSVDLDALDLADATLRNDRGETLAALPWTAPKGGHHREGSLAFNGDSSAFFAEANWIELVLAGVGDLPERVLRWEIGS